MEQYLDLATAKANNAESLWCPVWVVSCMLKVEIFYSCCSKKKKKVTGSTAVEFQAEQ